MSRYLQEDKSIVKFKSPHTKYIIDGSMAMDTRKLLGAGLGLVAGEILGELVARAAGQVGSARLRTKVLTKFLLSYILSSISTDAREPYGTIGKAASHAALVSVFLDILEAGQAGSARGVAPGVELLKIEFLGNSAGDEYIVLRGFIAELRRRGSFGGMMREALLPEHRS